MKVITNECIDYISKLSEGCVRMSLAYLEKVFDYTGNDKVTIEDVLNVLGTYSYSDFLKLTNALVDVNEGEVLKILDLTESSGKDLKGFIDQYLSFILDLIKYILFKDMALTKLPSSLEKDVKYAVGFDKNLTIFNLIVENLLKLKNDVRYDDNASLTIKSTFISIIEEIKKVWSIL